MAVRQILSNWKKENIHIHF